MKPKLLVINKVSALTKDFMIHTMEYFDCISSSDLESDIKKHLRLFEPEGCIYFMDTFSRDKLLMIQNLKIELERFSVSLIVIASNEAWQEIQKGTVLLADLLIHRPISPDNMVLMIMNFLEERKFEAPKEAEASVSEESSVASVDTAENVPSDEPAHKKNVLIVDDDRGILKMLKAALEDSYEITTIINGTLVEKFLETKSCDLIILDYEMPIMNGYDVFKNLKGKQETKNIPIIFLTGLTDSEKIRQIMLLRPSGYLLKPVNMDLLSSAIKNILMED